MKFRFIKCLPTETLQMVFKVGQEDTTTVVNRSYDPEYHEHLPTRGRTYTEPIMTPIPPSTNIRHGISKVCRYWRDVALETPGLWTTISLTMPTKRSLESAALCFRWSGQLPLDVRLKIPPLGLTEEFLQALGGQLYRVRVLVLLFSNHIQPPVILSNLFPAHQ
ncbi:MAG TPA: hypothetical protein VGO47_02665, partial [Chlamydiales bacterium]|nr:hypothetical protein [Chlamydiales bacterium]